MKLQFPVAVFAALLWGSVVWAGAPSGSPLDLPYDCRAGGCLPGPGNSCPTAGGVCVCGGPTGLAYDHQCSRVATSSDGAEYTCSGCTVANTIGDVATNCDSERPVECLCKSDFSSRDDCQFRRLTADCTPTKLSIDLYPYPSVGAEAFDGFIFINPTSNFGDFDSIDPTCKTTAGTEFMLKNLFWTTTAGSPSTCETDADVPLETDIPGRKVYVYIQHNPLFRSDVDQVIEIFCSETAIANGNSATFQVTNANAAASGAPLQHTIAKDASGLTLALKGDGNNAISSSVNVGDPLGVVIDYNDDTITIEGCIASDVNTFDSGNEVILVEDWCVSPRAFGLFDGAWQYVVNGDTTAMGGSFNSGGYGIRFNLKAWFFVGSSSNNLFIQCTVCFGCNPSGLTECTNDLSSFTDQRDGLTPDTRRRRDAGDGGRRANTTMAVYVEVARGAGKSVKVTVGDEEIAADTASCYKNTLVLLPIILLAVLLLFAMATTIFFFKKVTTVPSTQCPHCTNTYANSLPPYKQ